jgi:tetratricopeptide (TPR) repeat protein
MRAGGRRRTPAVALALACLLGSSTTTPSATPPAQLRGHDGLARVYDAILDARFDQLDADLTRACGPAPAEACDVLAATALWWQIQLDPDNRALDDAFARAVEHAIETTEAWVAREPEHAEAWFYMGGAYAARVQWRVLRDEKLAAARDGRRIHQALTRALALDPHLDDAHFGLGMYRYYAGVAPTAARILRVLLLLPGGDRAEGLAGMQRARDRGQLLQGEADYQLQMVYLWYESRIDEALDLLAGLQKSYPGNPLFPAQIAEVHDTYRHDVMASLAAWQALLASAQAQRVHAAALAATRARLGIARQFEQLHQTDRAIEQLDAIVTSAPAAPYGALALAHLRLGEAHDRLGARDAALAAYRAAIVATPNPDPHDIRAKAARALRRVPDRDRAEAYRLSLEGLRLLEGHDVAGAEAAIERSLSLDGADAVARYRYGRVLQARGDDDGALEHYGRAIARAAAAPPVIVGAAYLEAARLHERAGRIAQATDGYRVASTLFGAAADTHSAAARALARLGAR